MDKRYVLRKPIEAHYVSDSNEWYIEILGYLNNGEFDEMFVEFSFDATRKQIEEEARELLKGYVLLTSPFSDSGFNPSKEELEQIETDDILKFVDRVLALLGGTTNE